MIELILLFVLAALLISILVYVNWEHKKFLKDIMELNEMIHSRKNK
jgi:hypothetical protein